MRRGGQLGKGNNITVPFIWVRLLFVIVATQRPPMEKKETTSGNVYSLFGGSLNDQNSNNCNISIIRFPKSHRSKRHWY